MQLIPAATPTNTGWAVRAADTTTSKELILNTKDKWGPAPGIVTAELHQKWFTYAVAECPKQLSDLWGNPIDFNKTAKQEIVTQTGLDPVRVHPSSKNQEHAPTQTLIISFTKPVPRHWRLFGCSKPARLINKTDPPHQCENCWDYHSRVGCVRDSYCKRCGKSGHEYKECAAPAQCANCKAPHEADDKNCLARPKRKNGVLVRLTRAERDMTRKLGMSLFKQQHPEAFVVSSPPAASPTPPISSPYERTTLSQANCQSNALLPGAATTVANTETALLLVPSGSSSLGDNPFPSSPPAQPKKRARTTRSSHD